MVEGDDRGPKRERKKRIRRDPDTTRKMILDAAERVMLEEGYAAVGSRRVAQELELNGATIHYYYPSTDDLFVALHKRMMDRQMSEFEVIIQADDTLRALWDFQSGWALSALGVEFLALANHRKAIRAVLADAANEARSAQESALSRIAERASSGGAALSPLALTTMITAVARTLANEERVGITKGHREVREFVDWAILQDRRNMIVGT